MQYLILSDIHANLEALDAVLAHAGPYDAVLMLGDVVGYGASPNEVVDRLRDVEHMTSVRGNHDKVAVGLDSPTSFNHVARQSILWTAEQLRPDSAAWLQALPVGPVAVDGIALCHGSPIDEDLYIFDDLDAGLALHAVSESLCLCGHTHVPAAYRLSPHIDTLEAPHGDAYAIPLTEGRYLLNCGAVGQPRDGDWRAAFGLFDSTTRRLTVRRVEYDIARARARIAEAALPEVLGQRLQRGR